MMKANFLSTQGDGSRAHRVLPGALLCVVFVLLQPMVSWGAQGSDLQAGVAVRDITPDAPIWMAGYAARKQPSGRVDHPLLVQALALKDAAGERFVFVALDNCEVSRKFMAPVIEEMEKQHGLAPGRAMVVSSHTHSGPVLDSTLETMYDFAPEMQDRIRNYSRNLRTRLVEVVGAALADLGPARFEHGIGRATFAMNRRAFRESGVVLGENPDGPVDQDVPVLRVTGTNGAVRCLVFGYACHGTSVAGDDFYVVSGDYMAYARNQIEALYPGAVAMYLTGMGGDINPSPRGTLLDSKRHGTELAGAVMGVLGRPMRRVEGSLRVAFAEVDLRFEDPPTREQMETDVKGKDVHVARRAKLYLDALDAGQPRKASIPLPLSVVRIGDDLTFLNMGGEVVVDYAHRLKRLFADDHPWTVGYAYEVPCYIPSMRVIREGGYESHSSLIYYGFYGPFRGEIENQLIGRLTDLVKTVRDGRP